MKHYCPYCNSEENYRIETRTIEEYKGVKVNIEENITFCEKCGNEIIVNNIEDDNLSRLYEKYRELQGTVSPEDIVNLREKYNLSQQNLYKIFIQQTVDFDKINGKLSVRSKNIGDAYKFKGMTRKLKKLFNERGISQKDRATLPVICDESGIIWVPGFDPSDRVLCSKDTKNKIRIIYKKI